MLERAAEGCYPLIMESQTSNFPRGLKWYQGWRNIITLICFALFIWPVAAIIMWPLATWSKKTKLFITLIVVGIVGLLFLPFFFAPIFKNIDVINIPKIMATISRVGWIVILLILFVSFALSIFLKKQNKSIKKIWLIASVILIFIFVIMFIILMSGVSSIYNLANSDQQKIDTSPSISVAPVKTLDSKGKTYTNQKYGYEVKYPQEYSFEEIGAGTSVVFHTQTSPKAPLRIDLMQDVNPNREIVNIAWFQNFSEKLYSASYKKLPGETIEEISIVGKSGIKIIQPLSELDEISTVIFIPSNKDILSINFSLPDDSVINQQIINDFISSFRFLER